MSNINECLSSFNGYMKDSVVSDFVEYVRKENINVSDDTIYALTNVLRNSIDSSFSNGSTALYSLFTSLKK